MKWNSASLTARSTKKEKNMFEVCYAFSFISISIYFFFEFAAFL
jgi:hypothetical protein